MYNPKGKLTQNPTGERVMEMINTTNPMVQNRITYRDTISNIKHNPQDSSTKMKDDSNVELTLLP